jgi:drug/metabolite transporter (DMT)-like permease
MARSARLVRPAATAAHYVGYQVLLLSPFAVFDLIEGSLAGTGALVVLAGGVCQGLGIRCFATALRGGAVGVLTGLLSLMGGVAAILSVLSGDTLSWAVTAGLALASVGGVILVAAPGQRASAASVRLTLVAVVLNGASLWLLSLGDLGLALSLFAFNLGALATICMLEVVRGDPIRLSERDSRPHLLLLAAVLGVFGLAAFAVGADAGSPAVTAVLATQFAAVAAIGGVLAFGERMSARQLAGLATLIAGVSVVAALS